MLEFLVDNIFVVFGIDSRHSNGHKLCPSPSRHISVLMRSGIHLSSTSHTDTSMTYCQSITQILKIIWVRCIPLSLRSKTRRRASPLLPTWIYSCRSRVTASCALPFTNVTISTSISQTVRSIFASLWCFYLTAHTVCQGLLLL